MGRKRVVVTGMGLVSCFGSDLQTFYQNLLEGKSGIGPITRFPCEEYSTQIAGEAKDFQTDGYIDRKQARRVDPFIAYGIVAGKRALEHAQLQASALESIDKTRCGIIIGSGMGGMNVYSGGVETLLNRGHTRITPFFIPYTITNMASGLLAIELGFMGPNYSVSTACATGNHAIIAAANHIRSGEADLIVCGGTEAPILPVGVAGFCVIKALSTRNEEPARASRPWSRDRDGFVMGEGAGVLVLESLEHAQARGAPILAEYLGGAISCDGHHLTDPRPDGKGIALCAKKALANAEVAPDAINYINAHATATPAGDMAEIGGLKQVIAPSSSVRINATKSMIGHCLGAAGGIEAVATVLQIQGEKIHPTINLEDPEPDLEYLAPTEATPLKIQAALSNTLGFGGHNAAIVLAPFQKNG